MRTWRYTAAAVLGLVAAGCQEPTDLMVPVTPPGAPDRTAPVETGDKAPQAVGETVSASLKKKPKVNEIPPALPTAKGEQKVTASGVKYETLKAGEGETVVPGKMVIFTYKGMFEDGKTFDAAEKRPFSVGTGDMIAGWDQGVVGMKVGEKRKLIVPPALGYGDDGKPPKIPPKATLIFEVEAVEIN